MCECDSFELFYFGCKCGAFQDENKNHLWFNGKIYVIAKTEIDAINFATKDLGSHPDFNVGWVDTDEQGWRKIPDEELLTFDFSDLTSETLTAKDWAENYNPGYLAAK